MAMKSKTICNRLDVEEEKARMPIHKSKKLKTSQESLDPLSDTPQKPGIIVNLTVAINTVRRGSISMPIGNK
jgi:ribosomal protein S12